MKALALALLSLLAVTAHASLDRADVLALMIGQWSVKMDSGSDVKFVIRSSGDVMIVSNAHRDYVQGKLSFNNSTSDWGLDGLPVAHLILTQASDEDAQDYHLLVTGLQVGEEVRLKKLAAFNTFNDGPNEYSNVESGSRFKKYDPQLQQWNEVR